MTVLQERKGILHAKSEKDYVVIRSSGFCTDLSIHTHLLQLHCFRGNTTSSPLVYSMKPAHGTFKERICFIVANAASVDVPEFSRHTDPSVRHISPDLFGRGNPKQKRAVLLPRLYHQQERVVLPPQKNGRVVLKFLELSLSTMPRSLSCQWS